MRPKSLIEQMERDAAERADDDRTPTPTDAETHGIICDRGVT